MRHQFQVVVRNTGVIQWSPGGRYAISCEPNVRNFPFDKQTCFLRFATFGYTKDKIRLFHSKKEVGTGPFARHNEWELESTGVGRSDRVSAMDSSQNASVSIVHFFLHFRRKPQYYVVVILSPCIIMSVLTVYTFVLPSDSCEKLGLAAHVTLSLSVFIVMVDANVPHTSTAIPNIGTVTDPNRRYRNKHRCHLWRAV